MTVEITETSTLDSFLEKIEERTLRVGVIGLGYVGLPLVLLFEESGFPILAFDVDAQKTQMLNAGKTYIRHIGEERIRKAFSRENVEATTNFDRLAECDAIIICVPTPLGAHREPDARPLGIAVFELHGGACGGHRTERTGAAVAARGVRRRRRAAAAPGAQPRARARSREG